MSELLEKVKALEKAHNHGPAKREKNRVKYPEIAIFVDSLRGVFGEVRVVKVTENNRP